MLALARRHPDPQRALGYVDTGLGRLRRNRLPTTDLSVNATHLRSLDSVIGLKAEKSVRLGDGSVFAAWSVVRCIVDQLLDLVELVGAGLLIATA